MQLGIPYFEDHQEHYALFKSLANIELLYDY